MTGLPSLNRSATSCAWSKRRGLTVVGSASNCLHWCLTARLFRARARLPSRRLRRCDGAWDGSKSREGNVGRLGSVRTTPSLAGRFGLVACPRGSGSCGRLPRAPARSRPRSCRSRRTRRRDQAPGSPWRFFQIDIRPPPRRRLLHPIVDVRTPSAGRGPNSAVPTSDLRDCPPAPRPRDRRSCPSSTSPAEPVDERRARRGSPLAPPRGRPRSGRRSSARRRRARRRAPRSTQRLDLGRAGSHPCPARPVVLTWTSTRAPGARLAISSTSARAVDGLVHVDETDDLAHLVGLQLADEVHRRRRASRAAAAWRRSSWA